MKAKGRFLFEYILPALLAVILFGYYGKAIFIDDYCSALTQVPDEPSYLFNAVYLVEGKWGDAFSYVHAYYGFGYSILLIPLYLLANSGICFVKYAVSLNIVLVVAVFFAQLYVINMFLPAYKYYVNPLLSFGLCFCPFISSNVYETRPEIFISLLPYICIYTIKKFVDSGKIIWIVLASSAAMYAYYTHTRMICLIIPLVLVIATDSYKRKTYHVLIIMIVTLVVEYCIGYYIKHILLSVIGTASLNVARNDDIANNITVAYVLNRLLWMFCPKNFHLYVLNILVKVAYLQLSSFGLSILGILSLTKKVVMEFKFHVWNESTIIHGYIVLVFFSLFAGIWFQGTVPTITGMLYGRYYEWIVPITIICGIEAFNANKKLVRVNMSISLLCYIIILLLPTFIIDSSIKVDPTRLSLYTPLLKNGFSYNETTSFLIKLTLWGGVLAKITIKKYKIRILFFEMCLIILYISVANSNISYNITKNQSWSKDVLLAEQINSVVHDEEVTFVNSEWKFKNWQTRLQVFVKDKRVVMVIPESITDCDDKYLVTFRDSETSSLLINKYKYKVLSEGSAYVLLEK